MTDLREIVDVRGPGQPQQQQEPAGVSLDFHAEVQRCAELRTPSGAADVRTQRQPCRAAGVRHRLFGAAVPDRVPRLLHRVCEQRACATGAARLRRRYGDQLKEFQHRYYDAGRGRHVGGVVVSDYPRQRSGAFMFGS